jgi:acetyltransferase-like isoleucine patch superfamily enzyme
MFTYTRDVKELRRFAIGEYSYGVPLVLAKGAPPEALQIGRFCSFADGVRVLLNVEHRVDWITTYPFPVVWDEAKKLPGHPTSKGHVAIGNDVWIGMGATIMSGVTIGDGAVIGAYSVIAKDVAAYSIVAGNPARKIRMRFSDAEIEVLRRIKWWNWSREQIAQALPILCSGQIKKLERFYRERILHAPQTV